MITIILENWKLEITAEGAVLVNNQPVVSFDNVPLTATQVNLLKSMLILICGMVSLRRDDDCEQITISWVNIQSFRNSPVRVKESFRQIVFTIFEQSMVKFTAVSCDGYDHWEFYGEVSPKIRVPPQLYDTLRKIVGYLETTEL
ncbi:hypothetical protein A2671_02075 [Candidatus Kaiserbacteria bacterium RIFCSPHIGHO2_01_FULL_49_13]|uniref:Uncharacterized protein n=1 Tax=Candidatus Kaiserbacteria bacterium RIFCSPHIGHO2_01_FULL_49_13 TaxID=1798477 RepID=A0A1F6CEA1_9BACT|nr:MAG: hypothetical protein A2671_02075 [Candidatus Kaiserbacteria bacterium RIFCSPHIGHO2_01_FULL_49_13]